MAKSYESAEVVRDSSGRQYHIGVGPGELAERIILVGDPARAERTAGLFDEVSFRAENREFRTFTGRRRGLPISVMSTGIGCDNMEIAVVELSQVAPKATFIRAGSCGGLQEDMELGDLVISTGAVRLEDTSTWFVPEGYPAVAHHEVVLALLESARRLGLRHHAGLTATASGFYGAQGRKVPGFHPRFPDLPDQMAKLRVANFEMETSTLLILSGLAGIRASTVCAIYAQRSRNVFIDAETKHRAELDCIHCALEAFHVLERMDRAAGTGNRWLPSTGLAPATTGSGSAVPQGRAPRPGTRRPQRKPKR